MATQLKEPEATPTVAEEPQAAPANDERDFEAEARVMGWKPEEEFAEGERRPREFRDAEAFVRAAEEKAGLQKQTISHLKEKVSFLERAVKKLTKMEQNAYSNALADIRAQMEDAVNAGDVEGFRALDKKADKIREDMRDDAPAHGEDPAEQVLAFRDTNPWYDKGALASATEVEVEARLYADRVADRWIAQGKPQTMPPSQFYAELAEEVNNRFPMLKHRAARAKPPSDVAPSTRPAARAGAKTGANLPPEAKAAADRYVRMKVPGFAGKTKEEAYNLFAKSYQWEQ